MPLDPLHIIGVGASQIDVSAAETDDASARDHLVSAAAQLREEKSGRIQPLFSRRVLFMGRCCRLTMRVAIGGR
jgi:hypothetical protein